MKTGILYALQYYITSSNQATKKGKNGNYNIRYKIKYTKQQI